MILSRKIRLNVIIYLTVCLESSKGLVNLDTLESGSVNSGECSSDSYNKTCCDGDEFRCDSGTCIPVEMLCTSPPDKIKKSIWSDDAFAECPDGSDEFGCSYKPCSSRSSKCFGSCLDLGGNRSRCSCDNGYVLETSSFNQRCVDVDECKLGFDRCSQICINLRGSYVCKCREGFDTDDGHYPGSCKAGVGDFVILYDSYPWLYGYKLGRTQDTSGLREMVPSGKMDGIDFDPTTGIVYWTHGRYLLRSYLPGCKGKKVTIGYPQPIRLPRGMRRLRTRGSGFSVDWVGKNIYWLTLNGLDKENRAIIVTKLDGRYMKILMNGVWHATALSVNPGVGVMYWTWSRTKYDGGISTAWMDGRYRKNLLRLPAQEPVGLTLDLLSDGRIYWMDSVTHTIYYAVHNDADSIHPSTVSASKPFKVITTDGLCSFDALSVFENSLYWLNRGCDQLLEHDKFGRGMTNVLQEGLSNCSFINVYHEKATFPSKRFEGASGVPGPCSHLTLIHPKGFDCACPDARESVPEGDPKCDRSEKALPEPLRCDCTDKRKVCDPSSPYSVCFCFGHCDNYTLPNRDDSGHFRLYGFVLPGYQVFVSILPLLLVLVLVGAFIFITYPLNSGIPLEWQ